MLDPDIDTVAGETSAAETPTASNTPEPESSSAARPRRRSAGRPAGPPVAAGLMFQAPDTTLLPPLPREEQASSGEGDDPDRDTGGEGGQSAQRRKRSRGGRRRRKPGEEGEADGADETRSAPRDRQSDDTEDGDPLGDEDGKLHIYD